MFATDRDLLALEPNLFRDVGWIGQRLTRGTATLAGSVLTCSAPEVPFDAAAIGFGHVVTVGGVSYEVVSRLAATQLQVSRLRVDPAAPTLPPTPIVGAEMSVVTFAPQINAAHERLLRDAGFEPGPTPGPTPAIGMLGESSILNPEAIVACEVAAALELIFAAAGSGMKQDHPAIVRSAWYAQRARVARERCILEIDADGDGVADRCQRLHIAALRRD